MQDLYREDIRSGPVLECGMKNEGRQITCPICKQGTRWDDNPFRPFCSERCKLIDLGNWAAEDYRIPGDKSDLPEGNEDEKKITEK